MPSRPRGALRPRGGGAAVWTISRADLVAGGGESVRLVHASLPDATRGSVSSDGLTLGPVALPRSLAPLAPADAARFLVRFAGLAAFLKSRGLGVAPEDVRRLGARPDDASRPWLAGPPVPEWRAVPPALAVAGVACRLSGARLASETVGDLAREVEEVAGANGGAFRGAALSALRAHEAGRAPEPLLAELAARHDVGREIGPDLLGLALPSAFETEPAGAARAAVAFGAGALHAARGFARRRPGSLSFLEVMPGRPLEEGGALRGAAAALSLAGDPRAELLRALTEGARPPAVAAGTPLALLARDVEAWDRRSRAAWRDGLGGAFLRLEARARAGEPWERVDALRPRLDASHVSALVFLPFRSLAHAFAAWEGLARAAGGDLGRLFFAAHEMASRFEPASVVPVRPARARRTARDGVLEACALLADGFGAGEVAAAAGVAVEAAREALAHGAACGVLVPGERETFLFAEEEERARRAARLGARARADAVRRLAVSEISRERLLAASLARGAPEDLAAARARFLELARDGRLAAALPLLRRAPESDPDLGVPLAAMQAFDESGERARAARAASRVSPSALLAMPFAERLAAARTLARLGQADRALAILGDDAASLLARARVVLDAHRDGESERLLEAARRGGPLSKEEEAELHLMHAEIAWRRQEFPRALGGLRRAMRALAACDGDGSLESFATAGVLASDLGRTDEAVALFRRVREGARDGATRADASLDIAVALLHAGRAVEAERELEAALAGYEERGQHERYLSALGNRVELAILRGDFAAAREDLARVLVHDAAPGRDHQFLFSVTTRQHLALLDGDLDAAAAAFREAESRPAFARHAARREALALEAARLLAAHEPAAARRHLADAASIPDNRLQTAPLLTRLEASAAIDLGETPDLSHVPDGESSLLDAEMRMARNVPPDEAALAELRRRARTAAGAGEVAARVLEWSGRFPGLFASERAEPVLDVARAAAARSQLERAAERLAALGRRRAPVEPVSAEAGPHPELIAEDDSTRAVLEVVRKVAKSRLTVLVLGETGTGKELVARELHRASGRSPFVAVNVAALAPSLVESELFGHARGAFTGADRPREGLLESASKGTLFLDEIGDLPLPLQAKLLRALQERSVTRVGEVRPRAVDLRVVAATHRDLAGMVAAGAFRADLYHRLSGVVVSLAPLRERPRDLAAILELSLEGRTLAPEARRLLLAHRWPGNVRELVSAVESARVLAAPSRRVDLAHLPLTLREAPPARGNGSYHERVDGERRRAILEALALSAGNRTRAARALDLSRQSLLYEMKKLGIR